MVSRVKPTRAGHHRHASVHRREADRLGGGAIRDNGIEFELALSSSFPWRRSGRDAGTRPAPLDMPTEVRPMIRIVTAAIACGIVCASAWPAAQAPGPGVRVERLLDGPIITPDLHPSIGVNIQGPSLIRVPDWVPDPLGAYYPLLRRPQGVVHPPGVCRRPARAVDDPPARQPADRRFALPDRAARGAARRGGTAARLAAAARRPDGARRAVRGDHAAHRLARRARRRRQPAHRHVLPRPRRCRHAGHARGDVARRHPLRGAAREARADLHARVRARRLHLRHVDAGPVLPLAGTPWAASRQARCCSTPTCATPRS